MEELGSWRVDKSTNPAHSCKNKVQSTPKDIEEIERQNDVMIESKDKCKRLNANKYKTAICRHYMRLGYCKLGDSCNFAHSKDELTNHRKKKSIKNCKAFFASCHCMDGPNCDFHHERRHIDAIHRYFYVCRLITSESLQSYSLENEYSNENRLPIFEHIHSLDNEEN